MKKSNFLIFVYILIVTLYTIFCLLFSSYNSSLLAMLLLVMNLLSVYMFKDNKKMFFLLLVVFYFNYSILICKYLFGSTFLLQNLFNQVPKETLDFNLVLFTLFNSLFILFLFKYKDKKEIEYVSVNMNPRARKLILFAIYSYIIFVLFYHVFARITYNTALFEYLVVVFIIGFYISKEYKNEKIFLEILMILCSIYQLYIGERISVLDFLIVDFMINYIDKLSKSKIVVYFVAAICFFTFMGVYGDLLDSHNNLSNFSFKYVYNQFYERRFALDTSVSAYFSSVSIVSSSTHYSKLERLKNFRDYMTKFLLLGSRGGYNNLSEISHKYYVHYGGGYLYSYFYYWLGLFGIIFIAFLISKFLKYGFYVNKEKSKPFNYLLAVYLISTMPRWYLYEPTTLFRGFIIFIVVYIMVFKLCVKAK